MAWRKGQSGNPNGRPPGSRSSIREELRRLAAEKDANGHTNATRVAEVAWKAAIAGDLEAVKWITDQIEGKLPTPEPVPSTTGRTLRIVLDEGPDGDSDPA
jgi:hypothetical protein